MEEKSLIRSANRIEQRGAKDIGKMKMTQQTDPEPARLTPHDNSLQEPLRIYNEERTITAVYHSQAREEMQKAHEKLDQTTDLAYSFAALAFSVKAGKEWIVSEGHIGEEIASGPEYVFTLLDLLGITVPQKITS